jgi:hypothetical protein
LEQEQVGVIVHQHGHFHPVNSFQACLPHHPPPGFRF